MCLIKGCMTAVPKLAAPAAVDRSFCSNGKDFSVFLHFLGMGRQLRDGSLRQAETDAETEYKQ